MDMQCEFESSFSAYVRVDGSSVTDSRAEAARMWAACDFPPSEMEPADVAAVFTCCVQLIDPAASHLVTVKFRKLRAHMAKLMESGKLPLKGMEGHPVERFLETLLESEDGCLLYAQIAYCMCHAYECKSIRPFCYGYNRPGFPAMDTMVSGDEGSGSDEEDDDDDKKGAVNPSILFDNEERGMT